VTRFRTCTGVQRTIRWYNQTNEEKVDDIENGDTVNNLVGSFWNFPCWIGSFSSSESSKLSSSISESSGNENGAETVESIKECMLRSVPIA